MKSVEFRNEDKMEGVDLLIVPVRNNRIPRILEKIDKALEGGVQAMMHLSGFVGSVGQQCSLTTNGKYCVPRVLLVGIEGKNPLELRRLGGSLSVSGCTIALDGSDEGALDLLLGILLKSYLPVSYKTKIQQSVILLSDDPKKCQEDFETRNHLFQSIALARSLTAEPANRLPPSAFAKRCQDLESLGLAVDVMEKEEMERQGLHGLLAVGQGSANPPCLVTLRWQGADGPPVALVGKGVCFDSGGINIKTEHLIEMKWDKAGAAAVVGTMAWLARSRAPVNVIGVIGLVENMVDGAALKPGDVIDTHAGLTVEVVDTDNEGRLVLCDSLSYVQTISSPSRIIDLGTLTLETFGALAGEYAGLYTQDDSLAAALIQAGEATGENLWRLPMGPGFKKQIVSEIADLKNSGIFGYGEGGASAEFLHSFIKPGIPWAHLDISGVSWSQEEKDLSPIGVTGYGVALLAELFKL